MSLKISTGDNRWFDSWMDEVSLTSLYFLWWGRVSVRSKAHLNSVVLHYYKHFRRHLALETPSFNKSPAAHMTETWLWKKTLPDPDWPACSPDQFLIRSASLFHVCNLKVLLIELNKPEPLNKYVLNGMKRNINITKWWILHCPSFLWDILFS